MSDSKAVTAEGISNNNVLGDLKKAETRSEREGWVSDEEMQKVMGLDD